MKKIIASAVGLMLVGGVAVTTASAVENQFGGYWRTRLFLQDNFDGVPARLVETPNARVPFVSLPADNDSSTYYRADNRTRLYWTAVFNDQFKFVNKFEFNSLWGDDNGGDIGADGDTFKVKNSYADFTMGNVNTKLGIHAGFVARGFIFDDDMSGATITPTFGNVVMPLMVASIDSESGGKEDNRNLWSAQAKIMATDALSVTPYFALDKTQGSDGSWYLGADVDWKADVLGAWGSLIYNGGTTVRPDVIDVFGNQLEEDNEGWLLAAGVDGGMWWAKGFYASGDDSPFDGDNDGFALVPGSSFYWSEILGMGVFDNQAPNDTNGNRITNIGAIGGGAVFHPADRMKINADAWYAVLAEDNLNGDNDLGFELDGKLTYELMENLSAEYVLAYLFAGDAVGGEDVVETGVRISLKF